MDEQLVRFETSNQKHRVRQASLGNWDEMEYERQLIENGLPRQQ